MLINAIFVIGTAAIMAGERGTRAPAPERASERIAPAPGVITIAAASSLREALGRVAARYEESHPGSRVRIVYGASNDLARQILEGAPVDLFLSADARSMDAVETAGKLEPGTRFGFLRNSLVVIVPADSREKVERAGDLLSQGIRRVALCDESVPLGHHARAWLSSMGILAKLEGRIVRPQDARASLAMVETGAVDAGFVYATDARLARSSRIAISIPSAETPGIVYPAAALLDGPNLPGGRNFLDFARSSPAVYFFLSAGFELAGDP